MSEAPGAPSAYCANCGAALTRASRFCPQCGIRVAATPAPGLTAGAVAGDPWTMIVARLREATRGEYEVLRELGRGGMAAVYLAHEAALNRKVAIKVMSPSLLVGEGMVERFRQEAVTVANLSHPNIVTIHAVRQLDDLHFFTMQFVEGRSLDRVVQARGALPLPVVRALLFMVGSALGYAHRRGVVHRDVKPGNVLLDSEGHAIVTDFGIAKVAQDAGITQHLTQTGTLIGTPTYISPEQCYAQPVSAASDQYSLGIVAYELLTGNPPFVGTSFTVMQAHTERAVPPIRDHCPGISDDFEAALLRMLEKDPAKRWPSMQHALAALDARPLGEHDELREALADMATRSSMPVAAVIAASPREPLSATDVVGPPPPYVASVAILSPPDSVEVRESITLVATARSASGGTMPGARIAWSSDDPEVASIDERRGVVKALSPGEVTITARAEGVESTVTLRVTLPHVQAVNVSIPPGTLHVGEKVRLSATPVDRRAEPLGEPVSWMSASPEIAEFGPDGLLVARKPGTVLVWAEAEGVRGSAQLEVAPAPVARLQISDAPESIEADEAVTLAVAAFDAGGAELTDRVVAWTTSDRAIATVDGAGRLQARAEGSVLVRATSEGVATEHRLFVTPQSVSEVRISAPEARLRVGRKAALRAVVVGRHGQPLEREVAWYTTAPETATIDAKGVVTLRAPGEVTLIAMVEGGQGSLSLTIPPPTSREIAAARLRRRLVRQGLPGSAAAALLVWGATSLIGTVGARGDAAAGSTSATSTMSASAAASGGESVVQASRAPAAVQVAVASALRVGDTVALQASVLDSARAPMPGATLQWQSSDPSLAAVVGSALVARAPGSVTITASNGGASGTAAITIAPRATAATPLEIVASPVLRADERVTLHARGGDPSVAVRWRSSAPGVLRVDERTGRAVALGSGTAVVVAQRGEQRAERQVTVQALAARTDPPRTSASGPTRVDSLIVSLDRSQLRVGEGGHATATTFVAGAPAQRPVVWRSSDASVASVDEYGAITPRRAGEVEIIATADGQSARARLFVPAPAAAPRAVADDGAGAVEALTSATQSFRSALEAKDASGIASLFASNDAGGEWLREKLRDRSAQLRVVRLAADAPQVAGAVGTVRVRVDYEWLNSVRRKTAESRSYEVRVERGDAGWRAARVRSY